MSHFERHIRQTEGALSGQTWNNMYNQINESMEL